MIHMRNVGRHHLLMLDINTDKSMVIERKTDKVFITFDSNAYGFNHQGEQICHLMIQDNHWVVNNDLGIETCAVSFDERDSIYKAEADFALKWLQMQHIQTT